MDIQRLIAFTAVGLMLARLLWQRKSGQVNLNEFMFWLLFWLLAGASIVFIKQIDNLVRRVGFGSTGINVLVYVSIVALFYFIFKLRIQLAKIEGEITKIVREISIRERALNNRDSQR